MPRKHTYQWKQEELEEDARPLSRSAKKRQSTAVQKLGEQIAHLTAAERNSLPLSPDLAEAFRLYNSIKNHEGKRRQMQYIGRLMREVDTESLEAAFSSLMQRHTADTALLHRVEQWRSHLLDASNDELLPLLRQYVGDAAESVLPVVQAARQEEATAPPHARRKLFRMLMQCMKEK